ncbi:MAG: DUF935 family protein [Candidatus Pacebacteria bacterium]|nr:DUF935 family protein [Candidatus Paceibacterota bacterium]
MAKLLDQNGNPISSKPPTEAQTVGIRNLAREFMGGTIQGLTPARLHAALQGADAGNLLDQHRIFSDMEQRDAHLVAEMTKRKLAVARLDWQINPPYKPSAAETMAAEWLNETINGMVSPLEDVILALMDGVGHGFAAVELEWSNDSGHYLPRFYPRPNGWFRLDPVRRQLRLRDDSAAGAVLRPFGWMIHSHGIAKTGYLARQGLYRVLVWPYLYKHYAVADYAQLLEIYGLPYIIGKYPSGSSVDEQDSLMEAVTNLGHDARGVMSEDMKIEILAASSSGIGAGSTSPHLVMVDWAERSISKAILGQTMSAESQSSGIGSGNAKLHGEVRQDILDADARQIAGTITRDLLYPLLALNYGFDGGLARCPQLVFNTAQPEDLKLFADSIPKLVDSGMEIPVAWLHTKLQIPIPAKGEKILQPAVKPAAPPPPDTALAALMSMVGLTAAAKAAPADQPDAADNLLPRAAAAVDPQMGKWLSQIELVMAESSSFDDFKARLLGIWDDLDAASMTARLAEVFAAAQLLGTAEVAGEVADELAKNHG